MKNRLNELTEDWVKFDHKIHNTYYYVKPKIAVAKILEYKRSFVKKLKSKIQELEVNYNASNIKQS